MESNRVSRSRWSVPMVGRSPRENHRAATPLELFFDLVFVVAVASAAGALHHGLAEGVVGESVLRYVMVFFAIWWAWMNFTWMASAYDPDDGPYRLLVLGCMSGALVLAAGVPAAFSDGDFAVVTAGYTIMRIALVALWLRAARSDQETRPTAIRYAVGLTLVQVGWILLLLVPESFGVAGFVLLVVVEMTIPVWAEMATATPWHPEHIVERYGLFTIIVLGESILAGSLAVSAAVSDMGDLPELLPIVLSGLAIVFSMWWLYFDSTRHEHLTSLRRGFVWGYGHYVVWTAAAAVGAGLAVAVDYTTDHASIGPDIANLAVSVPTAAFLLSVWALHGTARLAEIRWPMLVPTVAVLMVASSFTSYGIPLTALLLVSLLAFKLRAGDVAARGERDGVVPAAGT